MVHGLYGFDFRLCFFFLRNIAAFPAQDLCRDRGDLEPNNPEQATQVRQRCLMTDFSVGRFFFSKGLRFFLQKLFPEFFGPEKI